MYLVVDSVLLKGKWVSFRPHSIDYGPKIGLLMSKRKTTFNPYSGKQIANEQEIRHKIYQIKSPLKEVSLK